MIVCLLEKNETHQLAGLLSVNNETIWFFLKFEIVFTRMLLCFLQFFVIFDNFWYENYVNVIDWLRIEWKWFEEVNSSWRFSRQYFFNLLSRNLKKIENWLQTSAQIAWIGLLFVMAKISKRQNLFFKTAKLIEHNFKNVPFSKNTPQFFHAIKITFCTFLSNNLIISMIWQM